jgi:serine/threonine-protein kinase
LGIDLLKKIGKYEILGPLGEGGMGVVYKAFDPLMERQVAIKVLSDNVFGHAEIKERFYREARSAGQLSHENITIFHDLGEVDGKPYIVMEYLTGTDLRAIIKNQTDLSLRKKLEYAAQISRGLAYSHSRGIIHRDVKPENIRILDEGKVKIMDFGIAKPATSTMTQTGTVMGTPFYMSPEQIKGLNVDHRSDIFSFGVLLYELLTYKLPFPGESPTTVSYKIVHEPPEPFDNSVIANVSGVRQVILKCLEKEPPRRFNDLNQVAAEIDNIVRDIDDVESQRIADQARQFDKLVADSERFLAKKNFPKAIEFAEKAASLKSTRITEFELIQRIREGEAAERQRKEIESRVKAANRLIGNKEFEPALAQLFAALEIDPHHAEATKLIQTAKNGISSQKQQEQVNSLLTEAKWYLKNEEITRAAQRLDAALKLDPQNVEAATLKNSLPPSREAKATTSRRAAETVLYEPSVNKTEIYTPPPTKRETVSKTKPPRSIDKKRIGLVAAAAIAIAGFIVYRAFFASSPTAVGQVSLNILPWAEVAKITSEAGEDVAGFSANGEKLITPCRISLPVGQYRIQLTNPFLSQTLEVPVVVEQGRVQVVTQKIPGFEYDEILSRMQ